MHRYKIDKTAKTKVIRGLSEPEKEAFVFRANFVRRNLSPDQKKESRKKMKVVAGQLSELGWTQKRIGDALGVARETVRNWFTTNGQKAKGCDVRVKVNVDAKEYR